MTEQLFRKMRPPEHIALLNPAFIALLTAETCKAYAPSQGLRFTPFLVVALSLALSLKKSSRDALPSKTSANLFNWIDENQKELVGLHGRVESLIPFIKDAVIFASQHTDVVVLPNLDLRFEGRLPTFTSTFLANSGSEVPSIVKSVRFMGRWLAKSGQPSDIFAAWGIMA